MQATEDNLPVLCDLSPCTRASTPASAPPASRPDAGSCIPGIQRANKNTGPLTALPPLCLPSRACAQSQHESIAKAVEDEPPTLRTTPPSPPSRPRPEPGPRPSGKACHTYSFLMALLTAAQYPRLLISGLASSTASKCEAGGGALQHGYSWQRRPGTPSHHSSCSPYGSPLPFCRSPTLPGPPNPATAPSSPQQLPPKAHALHPPLAQRAGIQVRAEVGGCRCAGTRWERGGSACHAHARAPPAPAQSPVQRERRAGLAGQLRCFRAARTMCW